MTPRLLIATAALFACTTAAAQTPAAQTPAQGRGAATPPAAGAPNAAVPAPHGFTYDPDGRRDPFVSLVQRGADSQRPTPGSRPAGLPGLGAGEVNLRGIVASRGGFVAIVQGADNRTYIVRPGDKLLDGTVRTISIDAMVILQQVNDPLSLERQREVRKVLRQTEEAK
jgi:Tfp pilus assembly protein PilP